MRKLRNMLVAAVLVAGSVGVFAPAPAKACTGDVCDGLCNFMNSKVGRIIFKDGCQIR